jgi:hypothetical protein
MSHRSLANVPVLMHPVHLFITNKAQEDRDCDGFCSWCPPCIEHSSWHYACVDMGHGMNEQKTA